MSTRISNRAGRLPAQVGALMVATMALLGCGKNGILVGGAPNPHPVHTIASLSPDTSEIGAVYSKLVGRGESDNYPLIISKDPVIVTNMKPDYEKIASLKPDLIAYDADLYNASDLEKIKELNIPTFALSGDTVDDTINSLFEFGSMTGTESRINDYVVKIRNAIDVCRADAINPAPKTVILMTAPNSNPYIAGTGSFSADLVRVAGAEMVGPADKKFVPITPEALMALNPDVIVVVGSKGDTSGLTSDSHLAALKAIKDKRYFGIDGDFLLRRGTRIDVTISHLHQGLVAVSKGLK